MFLPFTSPECQGQATVIITKLSFSHLNIRRVLFIVLTVVHCLFFCPTDMIITGQAPNHKKVPEKKLVAGLRHSVASYLRRWQLENKSKKMRGKPVSGKAIIVLCFGCFVVGSLFNKRTWTQPASSTRDSHFPIIPNHVNRLEAVTHDCEHKRVSFVYTCLCS